MRSGELWPHETTKTGSSRGTTTKCCSGSQLSRPSAHTNSRHHSPKPTSELWWAVQRRHLQSWFGFDSTTQVLYPIFYCLPWVSSYSKLNKLKLRERCSKFVHRIIYETVTLPYWEAITEQVQIHSEKSESTFVIKAWQTEVMLAC